jgi:hypothetical protein
MSASATTSSVPMMAAVSQTGSSRQLDLLLVIVIPPWLKLLSLVLDWHPLIFPTPGAVVVCSSETHRGQAAGNQGTPERVGQCYSRAFCRHACGPPGCPDR